MKNNKFDLDLEKQTINNCYDILNENYKAKKDTNKILLIYDNLSNLNKLLTIGYTKAIEKLNIELISFDFYSKEQDEIKEIIDTKLNTKNIVILLQSSSFRMSKYRWRNLLYLQDLKVIEHPQLKRMDTEEKIKTYINSISNQNEYFKKATNYLIPILEKSNEIKIISSDNSIVRFSGKMDKVLENTANFEGKKNWGIRFPVGEILTESLNLEDINGEILLYCFPNLDYTTTFVKPFKCKIEKGIMISHQGPKEFDDVFKMIQTENEQNQVFVREFGLGLNKGIKKFDKLSDISSYERLEGVHFSLGMKHGIYEKKLWPKYGKKFYQRYHIDVFLDLKEILINNVKVYEQDKGWILI